MKPYLHFIVAAGLALASSFFFYIWHESGLHCGGPLIQGNPSPCGFYLEQANPQFLSLGVLCAFLVVVESVMALRMRRIANIPESTRQRKTRRMGLWLVLIGVMLTIYGLYMLNTTTVMCPAGGCDSSTLWAIYGPYTVSFYGGQFLIAVGAIIVLLSKFIIALPQTTGSEMRNQKSTAFHFRHLD